MQYNYITCEENDGIRILTIKTASDLNPLDVETLEEIKSCISEYNGKTVIITGSKKAFSAGANIKKFVGLEPATAYDFARRGHAVMDFISQYDAPVIAAINGYALGGGFELALACDFRICSPGSKFGLPEITLGILPGWGGTQRLTRIVGETIALDMAGSGRYISAEEALKYGLVTSIVDDPLIFAKEFAKRFSGSAPISFGLIKKLIRNYDSDLMKLEKDYFGKIFETEDSKEGVKAFLEKRKPSFTGK
ncbi:MAG: enoyl-CoA hydratase-related protein [Thermoplasmataceae archaeon]|jgi:enoyl-CoA hydratase